MAVKRNQNKALVVKYLGRHGGEPVTLEQICDATELSPKQVQGVMYHLIATGTVKVLARGHMWRYDPAGRTTPPPVPEQRPVTTGVVGARTFVEVGKLAAGGYIARDEETGTMYVVKELEA